MALIGLQAGHQNIQSNVDPILAGETGAPGEMQFNVAIRDTLAYILISYGFQVQLDDANANSDPNTIGKNFDFYLAIHAEGAPAGGAVSAPDPSVDAVNSESRRITQCIEDKYFGDTGIVDTPSIVTNNMTFYYMWNVLTAQTPCGIIECGDLQDPHDSVILTDHRRVALGIAHGICDAFGVEWKGDPLIVPTQQPSTQETTVTTPVESTTTSSTTNVGSSVIVNTGTQTVEVPITQSGTETPPLQTNPLPITSPVKPPMDFVSTIVWILMNIKRILWG